MGYGHSVNKKGTTSIRIANNGLTNVTIINSWSATDLNYNLPDAQVPLGDLPCVWSSPVEHCWELHTKARRL